MPSAKCAGHFLRFNEYSVIVKTKDEISRIKTLQKKIEQLKELLMKKNLNKLFIDYFLEVAHFHKYNNTLKDKEVTIRNQVLSSHFCVNAGL